MAKDKAERAGREARAERLSEIIDADWLAYFEAEHGRLPMVADIVEMADNAATRARRRVEDAARYAAHPEDFELSVTPRIITRDE